MKCKAIKTDGGSCQANTMHDGKYCFRHDRRTRQRAVKASSKGGNAKRQYLVLGEPMSIKTPKDIKKLMEKSINKLWIGEMPAGNPAGALGYLAKIFLEAYEKSDLEVRMELLEEKLNKLEK